MSGSSTRSGASVDAERAADTVPDDPGPPGQPDPGRSVPSARRLGLVLAVAAVVLFADQLTKWWALDALSTRTIHVIWTLQLNLVRNTGAAFSIGGGAGTFIAPLVIVVIVVLVWWNRGVSSKLGAVALGMVLGGAMGNLLDRALRGDAGFMQGAVVDFIDLQWWPVFNVADACVVVGGILFALVYYFGSDDGIRMSHHG